MKKKWPSYSVQLWRLRNFSRKTWQIVKHTSAITQSAAVISGKGAKQKVQNQPNTKYHLFLASERQDGYMHSHMR